MVKLTKIYTRGGDKGKTSLSDGTRLPKYADRIKAYGSVDELNSIIGIARLHTDGSGDEMLDAIQQDLFDLGADLATPAKDMEDNFKPSEMVLRVCQKQIDRLEAEIDQMNEKLSPLNSVILPGGSASSSHLHLARTVARRAEREAVKASEVDTINPLAITYLNRLSDHLFVLARHYNDDGKSDILWVPGKNR